MAGLGFSSLACVALLLTGAPVVARALDDLPRLKDFIAARESSYDRGGGNWDMRGVEPGETRVLADLTGPGAVTHIWFTHMYPARGGLRKLVFRAYFDGAETPCIESPLGDFFGLGHAQTYDYASEALSVGTWGGLNSFWRMPFAESARFTITNEGRQKCNALYYYLDYVRLPEEPKGQGCFHAQYRQAMPPKKGEPYVLLEAAGQGHYVGCNLSVEQGHDGWWGEGDDLFYIDGETTPSMNGTGSEDYFAGAWCYANEYAFPFHGMPFRARFFPNGTPDRYLPHMTRKEAAHYQWPTAWLRGDLWNVYRYHIADPVPFKKSLRLAIEHGAENNERQDHYSSVAYWYQEHPHGPQPPLAPMAERMPMYARLHERAPGVFEAEDFVDESTATRGTIADPEVSFWGDVYSRNSILEWDAQSTDSVLTLPVPVTVSGDYNLSLTLVHSPRGGRFSIGSGTVAREVDLYTESVFPTTSTLKLQGIVLKEGSNELAIKCLGRKPGSEAYQFSADQIFVTAVKRKR